MTRRFWLTRALGSTTGAGGIGAASIAGAGAEQPQAGASQPQAGSAHPPQLSQPLSQQPCCLVTQVAEQFVQQSAVAVTTGVTAAVARSCFATA